MLHIAWKTYTRYDVYGKCDCVVIARENYMHDIMYIRRSGMLRLRTITLGRGTNETRQLASYSNSTRSKLDSSELDSKC